MACAGRARFMRLGRLDLTSSLGAFCCRARVQLQNLTGSSGSQCPIPPTGPGAATGTRQLRRAGRPLRGLGPGQPRHAPLSFVSGRYPEQSPIYIGRTRKARTPRPKPACGSRAQRLPRRAHVPMTGRAGHTRLGTMPSDRRGRRPDILGGGTCTHDAIGTRRICTRFFALAASSHHYLTGFCFSSHAGHVLVSYAPVPSASPDGELK